MIARSLSGRLPGSLPCIIGGAAVVLAAIRWHDHDNHGAGDRDSGRRDSDGHHQGNLNRHGRLSERSLPEALLRLVNFKFGPGCKFMLGMP